MKFLLVVAVFVFATGAWAQEDARMTAAKAFVQSKGQQALIDKMISVEGVTARMGLTASQIDPEVQQILTTILLDELASIRPVMEDVMIASTTQSFTLSEIEALVIFYNSPEVVTFYKSLEGASAMTKMPSFMALFSLNMGHEFQKIQLNVAQRLQSEMSK